MHQVGNIYNKRIVFKYDRRIVYFDSRSCSVCNEREPQQQKLNRVTFLTAETQSRGNLE